MNSKKMTLLMLMLLNINFTATPLQILTSGSEESHKNQFDKYIQDRQTTHLQIYGGCTALIGLIVASNYIQDRYYNDDLVEKEYEYAQAWYNAMNEKHPIAHLGNKKFLQTKNQFPIFNNIYFAHDSLKQINAIYKKQLENLQLTNDEVATLAQQEFILIYQAGFIEKNCGIYVNMSSMASNIAMTTLMIPALKTLQPTGAISSFASLLQGVNTFSVNYNVSIVAKLILYFTAKSCIANSYDKVADEFACKECDIDCLHAAVEFFEKNGLSQSRIEAIKNQIAHREKN